jgi:hypothetical protein
MDVVKVVEEVSKDSIVDFPRTSQVQTKQRKDGSVTTFLENKVGERIQGKCMYFL